MADTLDPGSDLELTVESRRAVTTVSGGGSPVCSISVATMASYWQAETADDMANASTPLPANGPIWAVS
jgi:hypothetical protein